MHFQQQIQIVVVLHVLFLAFANSIEIQFNRLIANSVNCQCIGHLYCNSCEPTHHVEFFLFDPSMGNSTIYHDITLQPGCQSVPDVPRIRNESFCIDFTLGMATFNLENDDKQHCLQRVATTSQVCDQPECLQTYWIDCETTVCKLSMGI